jgi:cellulase/cellobiase CelA1
MGKSWLGRAVAATVGLMVVLGVSAPAAAADPTPTAAPTSGTCTLPPVSGSVVGRTATSLTFALSVHLTCGYHPASVAVYLSFNDAQMGQNQRGGATAYTQAEAAALTVSNLTPGTAYWYRFSGGGSDFKSLVMGPTFTATQPGCTATYQLDGSWDGGFVGRVSVLNTSGKATSGWRVGWTWPGGQSVTQAWSANASSDGASVSVINADYNGALAVDGSTAFGFLGNGSAPSALTLTCSVTS